MLSGNVRSIAITSITIAPDRQRRDLGAIEELALSIQTSGLIHPIVVTPDLVLVAGERRLRAHQHLGLTHILAHLTSDLDKSQLELIELDENIRRKELGWKEEVQAASRLYQILKEEYPDYSREEISRHLGYNAAWLGTKLEVDEEIKSGNQLVIDAPTFTTALNITRRKTERARATALDTLHQDVDAFFASPTSVKKPQAPRTDKTTQAEPPLPIVEPPPSHPYLNADFIEWAKEPYTGAKINFLHCDFPYGIDFGKHRGGASKLFGGYDDSPELYASLIDTLESIMTTHVAESAHLMFWLSARRDIAEPTCVALEAMGWKVNPVPLIWHRNDNSGILPDPNRGPRQVYEMCYFASRGDRKIVQAVSNVYACPKPKNVHASEKPIEMLRHFYRMFVDDSTVMLDPTMGSGSAVLAAEAAGAKSVLGLEAMKQHFDNAVEYRKKVKSMSD